MQLRITNDTAVSYGVNATITIQAGATFAAPAYCEQILASTYLCRMNQNGADNLGPLRPGFTAFHSLTVTLADGRAVEPASITFALVPAA